MARQLSNPVYLASPEKGVDGRTTLAGARAPVITDGRIGDFWIDIRTDEQRLYGPKNAAGWPDLGLIKGNRGWTPVFGVVTDGSRRVQQVIDWQGGEGTKPAIGKYVGPTGLVDTAAAAVDIRGPVGPAMIIDGLTPAVTDISDATQLPVAEAGDDNEKRTVVEVFDLGAVLDRRSVAHAQASNVRAAISRIRIGQLFYERVNAQPVIEGKFRTLDRWTADVDSDSVNGGWWRLVAGEGREFALTLTVGTEGDYPKLNDALRAASVLRPPRFESSGLKTEIKLLSGFVMAEQEIVVREDIEWVRITAEDANVVADISAATTSVSDGRRPMFCGDKNAILPYIDCKFTASAAPSLNVDGVAVFNGSKGVLGPNVGFVGFKRNLGAYYYSSLSCYQPGLANETSAGIRPISRGRELRDCMRPSIRAYRLHMGNLTARATTAYLASGTPPSTFTGRRRSIARPTASMSVMGRPVTRARWTVSGTVGHGFYALHGATLNCRCKDAGAGFGGANNCGGISVYARHDGCIEAEGIIANGCSTGIRAEHGSTVSARYADLKGCNIGISAAYGSTVAAQQATLDNCTANAAYAEEASRINIDAATETNCGSIAVLARRASTINAQAVTATGAVSRGANAAQSSIINAYGANFREGVGVDTTGSSGDLVVFDGGQICARTALGGKNVTVNTVSADVFA